MDICYLACAYRTPSGYCGSTGGAATCPHRQKKQTNADRIRSMTDVELAELLVKFNELIWIYHIFFSREQQLRWLRREIRDESKT